MPNAQCPMPNTSTSLSTSAQCPIPNSPSPNMFVKLTVNFLVVRLYNKDY
ncbi:hypothetical protein COO91_00166 [Nostoc flagelliforme CCNUN1]|uniref:Uncharacterized protein n=1 Tax=Nostoc flagelliforme CCNUN1 TaxID=2038116 RepID=A0A2K8SFY7_9NOSO|nr:hypothetical protein COO91_00166 [Nostoc flagelliforme CCNUN1]